MYWADSRGITALQRIYAGFGEHEEEEASIILLEKFVHQLQIHQLFLTTLYFSAIQKLDFMQSLSQLFLFQTYICEER